MYLISLLQKKFNKIKNRFDVQKVPIIMKKDFQRINIPKLPVLTTEDGIKRIKDFFGELNDWKDISELMPPNFKNKKNLRRSGKAGIFAGSLELAKEGNIKIKQNELFDNVYIKQNL